MQHQDDPSSVEQSHGTADTTDAPQQRVIVSVTVGRSDYGIYRPVYREILKQPNLKLQVVVTGAHTLDRYGSTVREIEADGMPIAAVVEMYDDPEGARLACGDHTQSGP